MPVEYIVPLEFRKLSFFSRLCIPELSLNFAGNETRKESCIDVHYHLGIDAALCLTDFQVFPCSWVREGVKGSSETKEAACIM